jgi:hypothetical protein
MHRFSVARALRAVLLALCVHTSVASAATIYWSNPSGTGGGIQSAQTDGTGQTTLIARGSENFGGPAVSGVGAGKIFYSSRTNNVIRAANLNGSSPTNIRATSPFSDAVEYDPFRDRVYYSEVSNIFSIRPDGTDRRTVMSGLGRVTGLSLDLVNNQVYWADLNNKKIERANLDGTGRSTILTLTDAPVDVSVDPASGVFFWSVFKSTGGSAVRRNNIDGTAQVELLASTTRLYSGVAVDTAAGFLYVGDQSDAGGIYRSTLAGAGLTNLIPTAGVISDITFAVVPEPSCATVVLAVGAAFLRPRSRRQ